jgi:tRNA(adenine34) deaminase
MKYKEYRRLSKEDAERYMREAIALAEMSAEDGEVPIGCVIVCDGKIVGRGRNRRENERNALLHAEIEAIDEACRVLGGWRLWHCALIVTLEPCPMCAGAIINARVPQVFFGAPDNKGGACGSVIDIFEFPFNHKPEVQGGILKEECASLLSEFFENLRAARRE